MPEINPLSLRKIFVIQLLLILPWLPFAALSGMAYDRGELWPTILLIGPFQAYPLLIIIFAIVSVSLKSSEKYKAAYIVAWLAPIISFGSVILLIVVGKLMFDLRT